MTITVVAIQAVVMEQFGYQISYKRKQWRQKWKQWLDYLVIGTSLMQSYLTSFLLWCSQILNVLCIPKWFLETTRMKTFFNVFFGHSLHLLKGLLTIDQFLVLMEYICIENIKRLWWLLWNVMVITNCFLLPLPLQNERIRVVGVGFCHVSELEWHKGKTHI